MRQHRAMFFALAIAVVAGCGTLPTNLLLGNGTGALDVAVDGTVNTDIRVNINADVMADITCNLVCNLNTGECETICDLDSGEPPTPEELGLDLYLASCAGCHGDPPGSGFAPDLTGKSAARILEEFADPGHAGGAFPNLTDVDVDNMAAYLASL